MSFPVDTCDAIWELPEYKEAAVVMIEEGQFFNHVYDMVYKMMDHQKRVYITALNGDSERRLFGDIYRLLPLCHSIEWLTALCMQCKDGTPAVYSKRKVRLTEQIKVAGHDVYEAVCGKHF
jgi:thymidine kinase